MTFAKRLDTALAAAERPAQAEQGLEPFQLVLAELITGGVERALRFENQEVFADALAIAQFRALEGTLALVGVALLSRLQLQIMQGGECVLDVDQCRESSRDTGRSVLPASRPLHPPPRVAALSRNSLYQRSARRQGPAGSCQGDHCRLDSRILHAPVGGQSQ